jgi:hypothetical protein
VPRFDKLWQASGVQHKMVAVLCSTKESNIPFLVEPASLLDS